MIIRKRIIDLNYQRGEQMRAALGADFANA